MIVALLALALGMVLPVRVFPSDARVPEQLLRVSLVFAEPPDDTVAERVRLVADDGTVAVHPFADPPLWSPDGRTLTLLLDPARQKRGLAAHRSAGFVLQAGHRERLELDGHTLKTWSVRSGSCATLSPARWLVRPVRLGSRDRLDVRFAAPIDELSKDFLAIADTSGRRAPGRSALTGGEHVWSFVPDRPWRRGARVAIHPRLEDPCGNEIGEPFEHRPGAGLGSDRSTTFLRVSFRGWQS